MEADFSAEQLISLVEERPVLWDRSQEGYKSRTCTSQAWREICSLLNEDFQKLTKTAKNKFGRFVVKRWKNMKDQHIKTLKKKEKSAAAAKKMKNYIYHDQLSFLKIGLDKNKAHSNYKDDPDKFGASDEDNVNAIILEKPCEMREVSSIKIRAMRSALKRKKIDLEGEIEDHSPTKEDHNLSSTNDHSFSSIKEDQSFSSTKGDHHFSSIKDDTFFSTKDHSFSSTEDHTSLSTTQDLPFPSTKQDHNCSSTKEDHHVSFFNGVCPSTEQFTDDETLHFQDQHLASTKDHPFPFTKEDHHSAIKEDRHLSFFNAIRPSLEQFTDDETLQFQSGVISVIQNIKKARLV
ncbi:uncharacterized protein LOC135100722 [Scylla paramamosain]|uniref:uncharacterized protein LOC135100722 n=1 Tax=Scylla paramamosain TaxID=85552 RepID=UPI00308301E3